MNSTSVPSDERGFALLAVLWVMVGVAVLGLAVSLAGREAVGSAQNRISLLRATWQAEDCVERARSAIAELLAEDSAQLHWADAGWSRLDHRVSGAPLLAAGRCDVRLQAAGTAIDVNSASGRVLHRLLELHRIPSTQADSLVAALLDWRDADTVARAGGAEHPTYEAAGLHPPRNGPLADVRELRRVRGWMMLAQLDSLVGVEADRVCLNHAPLLVLAALAGFTGEAVARVAERRLRGHPLPDLASLAAELSRPARDSLLAHYPDLVAATTAVPDAWLIVSHAEAGSPPMRVTVEVRLVHAGRRAAVVRRRSWIS